MRSLLIKIIKNSFLIDAIFLLIIFISVYRMVPAIFFQQDEWLGFGSMVAQEKGAPINLGIDVHFVPLNLSFAYSLFKIFRLNFTAYNIIGLLFHFINGMLIYLIAYKLFKTRIFALLAGVIFLTSSVSSQLIMWPAISIVTLSLTFALLAWIILLNQKKDSLVNFFIIAILMVCSFLVVEYSLGLLIFLPVTYILLCKNIVWKKVIFYISPIFVLGFIYFLIRLLFILFSQNTNNLVEFQSKYSIDLINKFIFLPLRYLSQLCIPEDILVYISHLFTTDRVQAETVIFNILAVVMGLSLTALIIYFFSTSLRYKNLQYHKYFIMIVFFLLCSSAPFSFLPGETGNFIIFPPRYLYFGIAGLALLIIFILKISVKDNNRINNILIILFIVLMIGVNIKENLEKEIKLVDIGNIRLNILDTIQKSYPDLPQKIIFYVTSDSFYYYQPEKILPFQSGFGQVLLVWYYKENFSRDFYQDKFLWEINSQGYKEIGDRGFGYYRDYQLLVKTIKKYQIPVESVIAFSWNGKTNNLFDITSTIQEQLGNNDE